MARRRSSSGEKAQKKKTVTVKMLKRLHNGQVTGPYRIMESLIDKHHEHLADAKIAIAWRFGWKPDVDGRVKLSSVKKGSDLDRELHDFDFVVCLNHEVWNESSFREEQMQAAIDHALCRMEVSKDSAGQPRIDENNRTVYRLRQPDIQEFQEVISRHGLWTADLERFAGAVQQSKSQPLFPHEQPEEPRSTLPLGAPRGEVKEPKKPAKAPKAHKPPKSQRPPLQKAAAH